MKNVAMVVFVIITSVTSYAQRDSTPDTKWVRTFVLTGSFLHKVQPPLYIESVNVINGGPTTVGALTGFSSLNFFPNKKTGVGIFAGLNFEDGENIRGSVDGKDFGLSRTLSVTYAGAAFFVKKIEVGVGYQHKVKDGTQSDGVRVYIKTPNLLFSSDGKMSNYFGYWTPFVLTKPVCKTFRLHLGIYGSQNGIGPVARLTRKYCNIFIFAIAKKDTHDVGVNIGF